MFRRLLFILIYQVYGMDKMLDKIDESLEAALFEKVGLPLIMLQSMSMSILEGN